VIRVVRGFFSFLFFLFFLFRWFGLRCSDPQDLTTEFTEQEEQEEQEEETVNHTKKNTTKIGSKKAVSQDEGDERDFLHHPFHPLDPCQTTLLRVSFLIHQIRVQEMVATRL